MTSHIRHLETNDYDPNCAECVKDVEAMDWLLCVRKYGLIKANEMFPDA
jgi:hypothetical protein